MAFRVRILPLTRRQIASWGLSDTLLVDVYLQLQADLVTNPKEKMFPASDSGMLYPFTIIDRENRLCEHAFWFRVYYHPDEETLLIASGFYRRQVGFT
jgi:hypothetical protein